MHQTARGIHVEQLAQRDIIDEHDVLKILIFDADTDRAVFESMALHVANANQRSDLQFRSDFVVRCVIQIKLNSDFFVTLVFDDGPCIVLVISGYFADTGPNNASLEASSLRMLAERCAPYAREAVG